MKIKLSKHPIKSAVVHLIPFRASSSVEDLAAIKESVPELRWLNEITEGKTQIPDQQGLKTYLFIESKKTSSTDQWLAFFLDHEKSLVKGAQLLVGHLDNLGGLSNIVQAFALAHYQLAKYTGKQHKTELLKSAKTLHIITSQAHQREAKRIIDEHTTMASYQMEVMDLVNGPGNKVNAPFFNRWARKMARQTGFKVKIFNKKQLKEKGCEAILAVNRGSEWDPSLIIAEYRGAKNGKTLGLVGKGVTFDTGGLSIKPSNNLHYMKSDMGGAAAVLGTIAAMADLKWPINVIALAPITDNCVDATAIKPGDVIDSYSGKTIEVINTDAEGRLILADALSYLVKNYEADHIIDLATLTGSSVRTFGTACAALFCNDEELEEQLFLSGLETGEKLWSLPLWDEYDEEMKSDIADIKNLSTRPMAGAITAAKFLQFFTHDHPSWAHLDIAGTAFGDTKFAKGKAATGYGVHLLCHFVKENLISS